MVLFMWVIWSAVLTTLFVLMVYRGTLTIHEEDQLFLGDTAQKSHEFEIQQEVVGKINRVQPLVKVFSGASALATIVLVGYYVVDAVGVIARH
jgi:hypothetical protein